MELCSRVTCGLDRQPECRGDIGPLHQLRSLQEMRGSIAESPWPRSHCVQMWSCNFEMRRRVPASLASRALLTNAGLKALKFRVRERQGRLAVNSVSSCRGIRKPWADKRTSCKGLADFCNLSYTKITCIYSLLVGKVCSYTVSLPVLCKAEVISPILQTRGESEVQEGK